MKLDMNTKKLIYVSLLFTLLIAVILGYVFVSYRRGPMGVGYEDSFFTVNGKRAYFMCGEVHYFRVPKGLWFDRLLKARRAGLNCIASYIAWNWHEPVENLVIFNDSLPPSPYESNAFSRDLESYIKLVQSLGMYFIARPGPYICSEWDSGAHPNWLYTKNVILRSLDENYIKYSEKWYSTVLPIISRYTVPRGGSVALLQIENEYFWGDTKFLMKLYEIARKYVNDIPIITNEDWYVEGTPIINTIDDYPSPWDVKGFDNKIKNYLKMQKGMPKMFMELEGGWFSTFGAPLPTNRGSFPAEWTEVLLKTAFGMGINGISIYMYHGGTNPGYYTGKYITTTYDYEAAIREWGELSKRYYTIKRFAYFVKTFNDFITKTKPVENGARATVSGVDVFTRVGDDGFALVVLRNLDQYPKLAKVVYGGREYPKQNVVRIPARNAKIMLINFEVRGTPFTIAYTSSEPLMIASFEKRSVLIVYGDSLEIGEMLVVSKEPIDAAFVRDVHVLKESNNSIVLSYVHGESDRIAILRSGDYELYIIAVSRSRADRTWYLDDVAPPVILVSNTYFVGAAVRTENSLSIELELDNASCGPLLIISPKPISKIVSGNREFSVANVYGILYESTIDTALCTGFEEPLISVDSMWRVAREEIPKTWVSIEPGKPLEYYNMLFNGYSIYEIEFNLSRDDLKELKNGFMYISYFNDYATAMVNGVPLASDYHSIEVDASTALKEGVNKLHIVLESMGHTNDGIVYIPNGVVGMVYLGKVAEIPLTQWLYAEYRPPYGKDFSMSMYLHNPEDLKKLIESGKILEKAISVDALTRGGGVYIKKFSIDKKIGRYILDLGKAIYANYYPRALLFVNKKFVGIYTGPVDITNYLVEGENEVVIAIEWGPALYPSIKIYQKVVNGSWKVKYGTQGLDEKWFSENFNDSSWNSSTLPITFVNKQGDIVWIRGKVHIEPSNAVAPLKLVIRASGVRALIYFNGQFIGRYADEGPQTEFYIPETLIKKGSNTIAIMLHIISSKASVDGISIEPYYVHAKTIAILK
ncbi:beta-galactosidase [Ignisphaera sp. 4213-co]|uniref:beta-galactosidase n=1 Tax=Ignisphaera cupida TaxID=3050454 RepID=A0ABD4Z9R2_9CREN|nr:beta-galactosidase [Ignisphaera sp. 4213-co]MDK6029449.1 beta-galactosidase [Ignisphaera sp. 4213-co]